jgi:hypothetical protein
LGSDGERSPVSVRTTFPWEAPCMTDQTSSCERVTLRPSERYAYAVMQRILGVAVRHTDTCGKQGAVDGVFERPDGTRGAVEVTTLPSKGIHQLEGILRKTGNQLPNPGMWNRIITVGSPADLPGLQERLEVVITWAEGNDVVEPHRRRYRINVDDAVDAALEWLYDSSVKMHGSRRLGASTGKVRVLPEGVGGFSTGALVDLPEALGEAFGSDHMPAHLRKLVAAEADERHLFLVVRFTSLTENIVLALMDREEALPTLPPPLPPEITHLWVGGVEFSGRIRTWSEGNWEEHYLVED